MRETIKSASYLHLHGNHDHQWVSDGHFVSSLHQHLYNITGRQNNIWTAAFLDSQKIEHTLKKWLGLF